MFDTHESVQARFEKMLMERTPLERLKMGCSMFDCAKAIMSASILEGNPNASLMERKKEFFMRFYGQDFNEALTKKILEDLTKNPL